MNGEKDPTKEPKPAADPGTALVPLAALVQDIRTFSMDLPATPDNIEAVAQQVSAIGQMTTALRAVSAIESGKRLIWLKRTVEHGAWLPLLERLGIKERTAQWQMAEARLYIERGGKRGALLLKGATRAFTEAGDAEDLDPDDLADPSKPAPVPRNVLQRQLLRLQKQVESLQERDEKAQIQVRELQDTLKAREDSSLGAEIRRSPVKYKLIQAQLLLGQADQGLRDLSDEDLLKDFDGQVLQYRGVLRAIQEVVDGIMMEHGMRCGAKIQAHVEEGEPKKG
jgi:hypothetical protein